MMLLAERNGVGSSLVVLLCDTIGFSDMICLILFVFEVVMSETPQELSAEFLRRKCTPDDMQVAFATTADIDKLDSLIGQERATRAIQFGIDIHAEGYNIFAMGPSGAGKSSTILRYLQEHAADRPSPKDWAYVRNPQDAYRPRALALPPGRARSACNALSESLRQLDSALKGAFSGTAYEDARGEVVRSFQQQQQQLFDSSKPSPTSVPLPWSRLRPGLALCR